MFTTNTAVLTQKRIFPAQISLHKLALLKVRLLANKLCMSISGTPSGVAATGSQLKPQRKLCGAFQLVDVTMLND